MKIIDINGKERTIFDDSLKVIEHEVPAIGPNAKPGETIKKKFVQVLIKPHFESRTPWLEWYPLEKFKEMNPNTKLVE